MDSSKLMDEILMVTKDDGVHPLIDRVQGRRVLCNADGRQFSRLDQMDRSALEFEIPDWEGNALRQFFSSWRFYKLIPPLMKSLNATAAASFLNEHGDNLSAWLLTIQTRHPESFKQITDVMQDVFPQVESIFTFPTQQSTVLVASKERYFRNFISGSFMSDGELAFLALVSLIFGPQELSAPVYCVEEPENHLHSKLIESLVELLKQSQASFKPEERSQVFITTHSLQFLDRCDLDDIVVMERREGATICTRPSSKPHLRELVERKEIGLGELFYSGALGSATQ